MARLGRNHPCPCKSGKKYKRCCGPAEQSAELAARRAVQDEEMARVKAERAADKLAAREFMSALLDDVALTDESNAIVDLIHAGQLDEAETRARALIVAVPEATDGLERLGHVYEARGDMKTAARYYREASAQTQAVGPQNGDHALWLRELADRIDPPVAATVLDGATP
jgi:tetratricopeptide (TPR) repeat protein